MPLRQSFDDQLRLLEGELLEMGSLVRDMLDKSVHALGAQDRELAASVVALDDRADEMDLAIEHRCITLMAAQQPLARDLRTIVTALKLITDLERIGDFAVDVAKTVLAWTGPHPPQVVDLTRLGALAGQMVCDCMDAFVRRDLELVRKVCQDDDAVDDLYDTLVNDLLQHAERSPECVRSASALILVCRYLERAADHAVNVAERVHYLETGRLEQLAASHRAPE
jgi:phosphate transport system protein